MPNEHVELDPQILETLAKYDSPTICNVIELLKIRPNTAGYMNSSIRAIYPKLPPVVGYATTVTFRSAYPAMGKDSYQQIPDHIERMQQIPSPRIVVMQDLDDPPAAAALGEVMARLYKRFGCVGFVTDGGVRDLLQVEPLNFALFASSVIVSHGYPHIEEVHVPVHLAGVVVRPGDLIHGDANGVVSIPLNAAVHVANACEEFVQAEKTIMDFLDDPNITPADYRNAWAKTSKQFEALTQKASKAIGGA